MLHSVCTKISNPSSFFKNIHGNFLLIAVSCFISLVYLNSDLCIYTLDIAALPEKDAGKDLDWNAVGNICTKYLEDEVCYYPCSVQ